MKRKYLTVYTTFPDMRSAKKIVSGLVDRKLVACGNIFKLFSIYHWQGTTEKTPEYAALLKTKSSRYRAVEKYITDNHPYDVPEIIAWEISRGTGAYLGWVSTATE